MSALFGKEDHRWLDDQRRAHFPPDRNLLAAHLTLFHHLPPSLEHELCTRLRAACESPQPEANITAVMSLGRGVAFRVTSPALVAIRSQLADVFSDMLTPQDQAGWRPHVTIQNKVAPDVARALLREIEVGFMPRPLEIAGLAAWWYRGGPWEPIAAYRFGGARKMQPPWH